MATVISRPLRVGGSPKHERRGREASHGGGRQVRKGRTCSDKHPGRFFFARTGVFREIALSYSYGPQPGGGPLEQQPRMARVSQKQAATLLQGIEQYRSVLTRFFRRRAHPADVDDLVQEVLLSLHARSSGGPIEKVEHYLFTVASRAWSLHSQRSRRLGWRTDDDAGDLIAEEVSAERILIARQDLLRVAELITHRLPPRTHEVFVLHRFEEMTYPTIAKALNISVSAVEQHISKALKILALGLREPT